MTRAVVFDLWDTLVEFPAREADALKARLAELLAATLNNVGILWRTSPALTELELHVLDWLAQLLGLPDGWHGHIEDTASTSTLAALIAARHVTGRNVVVCSEHAHSSVDKAARMLGMELRKVPSDDEFRMRVDAMELDDAAVVVATVGTTSMTSVDPVREIAERCHAAGTWLHVDAAYAGSAWVCPELRWTQDGVELADSLVVNAHKWLLTPMDCSCLWTSRPDEFRSAFSLVCFRRDASDEANEALVERVNRTGELFLSHTKLDGRYVLRLAIGNARTTENDVRRAWDVLNREAQR